VEEPPARKLKILPAGPQVVEYGGRAIEFTVEPAIPVTWAIDPPGDNIGAIINGIFRPADVAPRGAPKERNVIITATSKTDKDRSASISLVLKTK